MHLTLCGVRRTARQAVSCALSFLLVGRLRYLALIVEPAETQHMSVQTVGRLKSIGNGDLYMNEEEFLKSIDCRFPYENENQWRALIHQGKEISENASFGVLEEISRKPFGNKISEKEQLKMVGAWEIENEHPLVQPVIEAAKAIITNEPLSVEKTLGLLSQVQAFRNLYCALNIISFACDDVEGLVDKKWQEIVNSWKEQIL